MSLFIIYIFGISVVSLPTVFSQHGGPCPCDINPPNFLDCQNLICECEGETSGRSKFDENTQTCFRLANEPCSIDPLTPKMSCIPTATCYNSAGASKCICNGNLSPSKTRCHLTYDQKCSVKNDLCDPNKFLSCDLEGRCSCLKGSYFDYINLTCFQLPESDCSTNNNSYPTCVTGTICQIGASGSNEQCLCPTNSHPVAQDPTKCVLSHNEVCDLSPDDICNPHAFLECISNKCICKGENTTSTFDQMSMSCLILAENSCDPATTAMKCIPTATCFKSKGVSKCICDGEMSPNSVGLCTLKHGQKCNARNDMCDHNEFLSCDLKGRCSCPDGAFYVDTVKKCYQLPESDCSIKNIDSFPACIMGTTCRVDSLARREKCTCPPTSHPVAQDPTRCFLSHNQNCDLTAGDRCNPYAFLECRDGKCICVGEKHTSTFDQMSKSCFLLADQFCNVNGGQKCITSATCFQSKGVSKCICNGEMSANSTGFCNLTHGQNCNARNDMCDLNEFLFCDLEGQCACPSGAFFDKTVHKCFQLPESSCSTTDLGSLPDCPKGTTCRIDSLTRQEICKCSSDAYPNLQDPTKCFLSHNVVCDLTAGDHCDPYAFLECKNGKCICIGENQTSTFDQMSDTCLVLADQRCSPTIGMKCIPKANCFNSKGTSKCICNEPLHPNFDKFCYLDNGQSCRDRNDLCDPRKFLSCDLEGKCSCSTQAFYHETAKTCQLYPESKCSAINGSQECVYGTTCLTDPVDITLQKCTCPGAGFQSPIDLTTCVIRHNRPCDTIQDICDPYAFLKCHDLGFCTCDDPGRSWYDKETNTCYLKAEETCSTFSLSQKCTPNSHCFSIRGNPQCVCDRHFIKNRNGQCYLPFGEQCRLENDLCDPSAFLTCDLSNRCSCTRDALFDSKTNICKLLVNSSCTQLSLQDFKQPCVFYAQCSVENRCECSGDYKGNSERLCYLEHGSMCDPSRDVCDPKKFFECNPNTMTCVCQDELNSWYNAFSKSCFLLQGSSCKQSSRIWNFKPIPDPVARNCIPNAYCDELDKVCTCNDTLTSNPSRFCYLSYEAECSTTNDLCDPETFLECNKYTGKCACAREYETYYDAGSKTCHLIYDRPCTPTEGSQLCDPNAECGPYGTGNSTFRCQCLEDMQPNQESLCFLLRNQTCQEEGQTHDRCDPFSHLVCREDKAVCDCRTDKMYFDINTQTCITYPNEPCSTAIGAQKCTPNAMCVRDEGKCRCLDGYEDTVEGRCNRKYGSTCNTDDHCNFNVNLECSSGVCLCRKGFLELQKYIPETNDVRVSCLPGFNITCLDSIEDQQGSMRCNEEAFLTCEDNRCICNFPEEQIFVGSVRQCRSRAGSRCNELNFICDPNAICVYNSYEEQLLGQFGVCKCEANTTIPSDYLYKGLCVKSSASTVFLNCFWFSLFITSKSFQYFT